MFVSRSREGLMPRMKSPSYSKYKPHQGLKERCRRVTQMKTDQARLTAGDAHEQDLLDAYGDVWELTAIHKYSHSIAYDLRTKCGELAINPLVPSSGGGWQLKIEVIKTHFGVPVN